MIQPSLQIGGDDWAVKETKLLGTNPLLNEKLPVEIDVTNATIGTRVNKDGIIENGPRNLLTFSEDFNNTIWSKFRTVLNLNSITAPNNTLTASKLIANTENNNHIIESDIRNDIGLFTTSIFAKDGGVRYLEISVGFIGTVSVIFDLQTGVVTKASGILGTPQMELINGFYRCSCTYNVSGNHTVSFGLTPNSGGVRRAAFVGNNVDGIFIWGAQLEVGSKATEYYPTTTRTNLARIDYSSGEAALLIEPQRTNSLTNSELAGAATPSSLPTGFVINTNGLSFSVVEVGNEMGLKYVDIKLFGTAASSGSCGIRTSNTTSISASKNQNWSVSAYLKIVKEPLPPLGYFQNVYERNSGGSFLNSFATAFSNTTLQRITTNAFLTNVSTVFIQQDFIANLSAGENYDFTIRIAAPQMEQGSYASSYIPTLASAVTRNADVISKTGISDLINSQEGVFFLEIAALTATQEGNKAISFSDGTFNNRIQIEFTNGNNSSSCRVVVGNSLQSSFGNFIPVTTNFTKIAFFYKLNQFKVFVNGIQFQTTNTSGSVNSANTLNNLVFGIANGSGGTLNNFEGRLKSLQLYKTALTDAQLITLTTI